MIEFVCYVHIYTSPMYTMNKSYKIVRVIYLEKIDVI
jgi:hypothetical protein